MNSNVAPCVHCLQLRGCDVHLSFAWKVALTSWSRTQWVGLEWTLGNFLMT